MESRYKKEKDQDLVDQGFETVRVLTLSCAVLMEYCRCCYCCLQGDLTILEAYVQFRNPDDDDDIPLFQVRA